MTAFDFNQWTETFKQYPGYNDAEDYGVTIKSYKSAWWRVLGVHHLTGLENMGKHNVYFDVLNEQGQRINGARIRWFWEGMRDDEKPGDVIIDKPLYEPGGNLALHKGQRVSCYIIDPDIVDDEALSDWAVGLHIGHADEKPGNTWGHHSFFVAFQKVTPPSPSPEIPPPRPLPPPLPDPARQVGGIQVTVNVDWINALRRDRLGNVTFFVGINK